MKIGLREDEAIQEAREESNLLIGFTVTPDHSLVLCERGYTDYYRKHKEERNEHGSTALRALQVSARR